MTAHPIKTIGEVAKVKGGKRLPKGMEVQDEETAHPYLRVVDFGSDGIDPSNIKFISDEAFNHVSRYIITSDDIYVSIAGTIGRVGIVPVDLSGANLTENAAKIAEISSDVDKRYLLSFFRSEVGQGALQSKAGGTSQPKLALFRIGEIEFPCPPIRDQKAIAEIVSTYDDLIENNRRRMALLEDSARQLYHEWFFRLRFPGHEHARITKGLPERWKRVPVPDAIAINPRTPLSDDDEHWWVEMADLPINSMVIQNAVKRDGRSGSKFRNGDTLFARITPCLENGKTAFVNFMAENEVGRGSTEFIVLRSMSLTPEFVYCFARTYDFREHAIKSMIGASGRQRVQESCFEKFLILVPPQSLIVLFGESSEPVFEQIKILHAQNQKLRTARDLLLPRLMNGEIGV
jgi:type I restriction enzyme S subunit